MARHEPVVLVTVFAAFLFLASGALSQPQLSPPVKPAPPARDSIGLYDFLGNYASLRHVLGRPGSARDFHLGTSSLAVSLHMPVAGDWDGDGWDTLGIYDTRPAEFGLCSENATGDPDLIIPFGQPNSYPVVGDWDGDGIDSIGSYAPTTGEFWLRNSNTPGVADLTFRFGPFGNSVPVAGDFDGDGIDTIGVYSFTSGTFYLRNSNSAGPVEIQIPFGPIPSYPCTGDWDGDGIDTVGVFDLGTFTHLLKNSHAPGPADITTPSDLPRLGWPVSGFWSRQGTLEEHDGYPWPTSSPEAQGMNGPLLDQAVQVASGIPAFHSLLVVRNGRLVKEAYFNGWDGTMANNIKSASKSMLSALVGIAQDQGAFSSVTDTVASLIPQYFAGEIDLNKRLIRVQDLLTMSAGLHWPGESSITGWIASSDWVQWVIDQSLTSSPGSTFRYSTGLTHVGSALVTEITGQPTWDFARQFLFEPIGIEAVRWDHDPNDIDFGGSEVFLRPRDMARFGELFLNQGSLDGNQIVSPSWVQWSTQPLISPGGWETYGAWWWQGSFGKDAYFAKGHGGQFVFVFEDLNLVVVATSDWNVTQSQSSAQYANVYSLLELYIVPAAGS